jgi:hypothetical protein
VATLEREILEAQSGPPYSTPKLNMMESGWAWMLPELVFRFMLDWTRLKLEELLVSGAR